MKKKYPFSKIIILVFLLFITASCEKVGDCIAGRRPELISKELKTGAHNQIYDDSVYFEMKKANTNDYLIYSVSIDGELPPGINYSVVNNSIVNFRGTATKGGIYEFTVTINVRPYEYNEDGSTDLCQNGAIKKYTIKINN